MRKSLFTFAYYTLSCLIYASKPNIVVFFVDDMGYSELECYNEQTDLRTPNINKLAECGVLCTNGYVTAPQCAPSRAGILTGYYQQQFGFEANPTNEYRNTFGLDRSLRTLGDYMQVAGYKTGYVGKWDLGRKFEDNPEQRGFDYYYGAVIGARHYNPVNEGPLCERVTRGYDKLVVEEQYYTHQLTKGAQLFIEEFKNEPFFLFLSYTAPHYPFEATIESMNRNMHINDSLRRVYAGMVTSLDDDIGKIIKQLQANSIEDNTIVFFISDNGAPGDYSITEDNNLPLRAHKGSLFEGGTRVPYIVQWKNSSLPRGVKYHRPVSSLDLLPTMLAVADADIPCTLPGTNILPYLNGEKIGDPTEVLYWRWLGSRAVRVHDWKWVSDPRKNVKGLFNLANDMEEENNLINIYPEKAEELENLWRVWNRKNCKPYWYSDKAMKIMMNEYANEGLTEKY